MSDDMTIAQLQAEVERLRAESRKWFLPSGAFEFLPTADEVVERRKAAAVKLGDIESAVRDSHHALDLGCSRWDAAADALKRIEQALGMPWKPRREATRRANAAETPCKGEATDD